MDLNDIRVGVTIASFGLFVALLVHTWSGRRRREHLAAAALPFVEEEPAAPGSAPRAGRTPNPQGVPGAPRRTT